MTMRITRWLRTVTPVLTMTTLLALAAQPAAGQLSSADADYAAGVRLMEAGEFQQAADRLNRAVEVNPKSADYRYALSVAQLRSGDESGAWTQVRQAFALNDRHRASAELFAAFWQGFDSVGTFNVGTSSERVFAMLGKPDDQQRDGQILQSRYGPYLVRFVNDQLFELVDTRGFQPNDAELARESMHMGGDGRKWRLGYQARAASSHMREYVLPGETVQTWRELLTLQRMLGLTRVATAKQLVETTRQQLAKVNPRVEFRVHRANDDEALYEWRIPAGNGQPAQHEIARFVRGKRDIYRIAYAQKTERLDEKTRKTWLELIGAAKVVRKTLEAGHAQE